jgi:hypothetical protein
LAIKIGYHNLIIDTATGIGTQATITVYDAGTANQSTIYSDANGTAKDNPFTTDSVGRFSFFADPAEYDIQVSGAGITTYKLTGVSIIGEYSRFVTSAPTSGEYRLKKLRLDADKKIVVTYPEDPEA